MSSLKQFSAFWPDPTQELLLKSILLDGRDGALAWEEWSNTVNFDDLDYDACCLVPILYATLTAKGIETPLLPRMKGIYKKHWVKNGLQYRQLMGLLQLFHERGLKTIVIRGTAIALRYYRDYGLRPVEELDLLIQGDDRQAFEALLKNEGWRGAIDPPVKNTRRFLHPQKPVKVDLYESAYATGVEVSPDDGKARKEFRLWEAAENIIFEGHSLRVLCPLHQLLQILIQGTNTDHVSPYRWVMDACQIIINTPDLHWGIFWQEARVFGVDELVNNMVDYLNSEFTVAIPPVYKALGSDRGL
ncbi:MAG: hypothetical protein N5P05_003791 [Chroococcopsis gigantea SAG 12.99]|jgi:hypothetical protein|nr:nucleotidyltransferase family protein [Chlorogloea purpurea SAG 13.99]MDV3002185.1 hypothetical protein [Chroococcopsis gigantea SAG 12.99]